MPQARTIPATKVFWLTHRFPRGTTPRLREPAETREYDPPYRYGSGSVFRIPFTLRGIVVGRWSGVEDEDEAVWKATGGHELEATTEDVKSWNASEDYERWEAAARIEDLGDLEDLVGVD